MWVILYRLQKFISFCKSLMLLHEMAPEVTAHIPDPLLSCLFLPSQPVFIRKLFSVPVTPSLSSARCVAMGLRKTDDQTCWIWIQVSLRLWGVGVNREGPHHFDGLYLSLPSGIPSRWKPHGFTVVLTASYPDSTWHNATVHKCTSHRGDYWREGDLAFLEQCFSPEHFQYITSLGL
jgi:hypothetical protein